MFLAQFKGFVPRLGSRHCERCVRTFVGFQRNRIDRQTFISVAEAMRGTTVVADDAKHVLAIRRVARKGTKLFGHCRRGGIGLTTHQRGHGGTDGAAFLAIVGNAGSHQIAADIGIAQAEGAVTIAEFRDAL